MSILFPLGLGGAFLGSALWGLWSFWRGWPQRQFMFFGQVVSRERYPVSYWMGLVLSTVSAIPAAYVGVRILAEIWRTA